jgi:hypothetical protein
MIADIPYTVPDSRIDHPLFRDLPSYSVGTNISTLRIASQIDPREWTVIQDYRDKSILGGIAAVGGLGSFLSVFFVIWFGGSLFGIIFRKSFVSELQHKKDMANDSSWLREGTKPLTPFGIFHHLENQKARLSTSTNEKYRALRSDLQSLKENPGLLSFVFDALIDLDIIAEEHPSWENSKRSRKARLRDLEQDLPNENRHSNSDSDERLGAEVEEPSGASQRSIRRRSNDIGVENGSRDSESSDEGEQGPRWLTSQDTNEEHLLEEERRLLIVPSLSTPQFSQETLHI